MLSENQTLMA